MVNYIAKQKNSNAATALLNRIEVYSRKLGKNKLQATIIAEILT
jgi:hypothetical protein